MELTQKQLVKIAENIRDQLKLLRNHRYCEIQRLIKKVNSYCEPLEVINRGLDKSIGRNWDASMAKLTANIQRFVRDIPYAINELEHMAKNSQTKIPTPR